MQPVSPAWVAFELTWAVLALLALPVLLHLAWNGPRPGYLLPEYWVLFAGLVALLEMLVVAPLGLLVSGAAAVVRWVGKRQVVSAVSV